ncbi:hypothetical protein MM3A0810R_3944 [Mycobacteroides abscessus 3A-0810-R]|nr:hypothetical protein MA6G0125R_2815 [Mycobacteroides abscessus 6G-0125-R]EIV24240.1 hypothetical protein MA3A0122R_3932 [Mycobacteroides abscessus 3A-0122-R]EIV48927.1 hypothetical protein MA3A0930R_3908 [Mycobacteroides abscessus 3A-0930-R]EIV76166.1 hypothetical protein MM3A0810R_3944 [Mycobacteroides abscessus 3A-0810-R]
MHMHGPTLKQQASIPITAGVTGITANAQWADISVSFPAKPSKLC